MALRGSDRHHVKRARVLVRQLARQLDEAENAAQCRRAYETFLDAAETTGRIWATQDGLIALNFDRDDEIMEDMDMGLDVELERIQEFHACLREVTTDG